MLMVNPEMLIPGSMKFGALGENGASVGPLSERERIAQSVTGSPLSPPDLAANRERVHPGFVLPAPPVLGSALDLPAPPPEAQWLSPSVSGVPPGSAKIYGREGLFSNQPIKEEDFAKYRSQYGEAYDARVVQEKAEADVIMKREMALKAIDKWEKQTPAAFLAYAHKNDIRGEALERGLADVMKTQMPYPQAAQDFLYTSTMPTAAKSNKEEKRAEVIAEMYKTQGTVYSRLIEERNKLVSGMGSPQDIKAIDDKIVQAQEDLTGTATLLRKMFGQSLQPTKKAEAQQPLKSYESKPPLSTYKSK